VAGFRDEGGANAASEFGAMGMFCRLGLAEERRPVAVPVGKGGVNAPVPG